MIVFSGQERFGNMTRVSTFLSSFYVIVGRILHWKPETTWQTLSKLAIQTKSFTVNETITLMSWQNNQILQYVDSVLLKLWPCLDLEWDLKTWHLIYIINDVKWFKKLFWFIYYIKIELKDYYVLVTLIPGESFEMFGYKNRLLAILL